MAAHLMINDLHRYRLRNPRVFRDRVGLGTLSAEDIFSRYRFDPDTIHYLVQRLERDLSRFDNRGRPIDVLSEVLVTLRFLAKGDFYSEIADCQGLSRSSVSRIVTRVVASINRQFTNIRFPRDEMILNNIKLGFYQKCRIPNVVGAVDGTLIPIIAPSIDEAAYVCRKGYHALNVQAVVDHEMRFLDVVSKWPGSQHDASVFDPCGLKDHLTANYVGHLLGDSGYPLRKYLMTPILNPQNEGHERFNHAHSRGRTIVERTFGVLKSRFRCLHNSGGCLMMSPAKASVIITACMRLHNVCVDRKVALPDVLDVRVEHEDIIVQDQQDQTAVELRQHLVQHIGR